MADRRAGPDPRIHPAQPRHRFTRLQSQSAAADQGAAVSALEDKFGKQLQEAGLADGCYCQHLFHPKRGWRLDFAWPAHLIGVEVDGGTWSSGRHTRGPGWDADATKHAEAAILGWRVIRVSTSMVRNKSALELVERLLASVTDEYSPTARHRDDRPTHLVAQPWDDHALCGIKDPLPVVLARAAQGHVDGWGMLVCTGCAAALARAEGVPATP